MPQDQEQVQEAHEPTPPAPVEPAQVVAPTERPEGEPVPVEIGPEDPEEEQAQA